MMLNATQKESSNSDVRLRSNRRPKFLVFNSFQQVNRVLALLRSVALFDSKLHIQDDVKCNYSQKMNARAQRARHNRKRINSFGLTSQRENATQKGYSSSFSGKVQFYGGCPCSTHVYTIETSSDANAPKRRIEVHAMLNNSYFGREVIRAMVWAQIYSQNS